MLTRNRQINKENFEGIIKKIKSEPTLEKERKFMILT